MQDLSQNRSTAIETLLRSVKYGDVRFVLNPDNEPEYDLSIGKACCNIDDLESPDSCIIGGSNTTNRNKTYRRRKRISINVTAITSDGTGGDAGEGPDDAPERKRQRVTEGLN